MESENRLDPTIQTNIQGNVHTDGGLHNSGSITTEGGPFLYTVNKYHPSDPDKEDIDRLKSYTASTRALLEDATSFRIGSTTVKISRPVVNILHTMAATGSFIITGAPGIGKSGVLLDWMHRLDDAQTDYLFLSASNIVAHDSAQVRIPDTLSQDLVDVLIKWPGTEPAFLIIDALDGAKDSRTAATLVNLIKRLLQRENRWRVIVSIREFDLGHHNELCTLFKGQPAQIAKHPDYPTIRHIYINELNEAEMYQVALQAPGLTKLVLQPEFPLTELLKVPFNLRLAAELLDAGVELADLSPIQSQIELLDRFWETRVLLPTDMADARELILRRCIAAMIQQRALRCDRFEIIQSQADSVMINELLSCHILANWQPSERIEPERYVLTFAHHILFDFAVARLHFRASGQRWIERTLENPELIFIAYPSYIYHFHYLWHRHASRKDFWQAIYSAFGTGELSEISRVVGPTVAAALARALTDLETLLASLEGLALQPRTTAERILPHLIGSLEAEPALVTAHYVLWCTVAERLSTKLRHETVYSLNSLLRLVLQQHACRSPSQWQQISTAARALLQFAWTVQPSNPHLIEQAITAVCETYHVDPTSARTLLSRLLEPTHLAEHGYNELTPIAQHILYIANTDPDFARNVYSVVFAFTDDRDEPVRLGGQIMSLTTTKRQQYESVQGVLAQEYAKILTAAPVLGTQILIAVLNSYGYQAQTGLDEMVIDAFSYRGKETKVRFLDRPVFYFDEDEAETAHDDQITMLKVFDSFLCKQGNDNQGIQIRQVILDELADHVLPMLLVRRLLRSAAHHPTTLGVEVRELAWSLPLLIYHYTRQASGEFISAIFPKLEQKDRERIEETILSITKLLPPQAQEQGKYIQDNLILHLTPAKLVSADAQAALIVALQKQAKASQQTLAEAGLSDGIFAPYINQAEKGAILVNDPHYQAVNLHQQTIEEMAQNLNNTSPSEDQVQILLHTTEKLQTILSAQSETNENSIIMANTWDAIAGAAWLIGYWPSLLAHPNVVDRIQELLLSAAKRPEPIGDSRGFDDMRQTASWGKPAARIYAARGLLRLATLPGVADDNELHMLNTLANDATPSVRIQIAEHIHRLEALFPEFMWKVLEQRVATETHPQILHLLLRDPLNYLQRKHGERVIPLVQAIAGRIEKMKHREKAINCIVAIYLHQYLFCQSIVCHDLLLQISDHPYEHLSLVWPLAFQLRRSIEHRRRASVAYQKQSDLFNRLISSIYHECKKYLAKFEQRVQDTWTEADQQITQELLKLANQLGQELFFLSGAFQAKSGVLPNTNEDPPLLPEQLQLFWLNHHHNISRLADLGLPNLTYHILEILDYLTPISPIAVFLLFRDALRAAENNGYQQEKMGMDLALKIVNSFLTEHRAIFHQDPQCGAALLDVLDILLKSGWPDARKLAYQIYKVYR